MGLYFPPVFKRLALLEPPQTIISTASPDCGVPLSASGRIGGACGCPTICAGIVSPAGVQIRVAAPPAPDNHFTAGPDCRVIGSDRGDMKHARSPPLVTEHALGNLRQSVHNLLRCCCHRHRTEHIGLLAIQRAEFDLAPKDPRASALLILVWPNTQR